MQNQIVCVFCQSTGKQGAEWLVRVAGEQDRAVHKPCGEKAVANAPEGTKAELLPSYELKARWRAEREARTAKAFWGTKFAEAKPIRKGRSSHELSSQVPAGM